MRVSPTADARRPTTATMMYVYLHDDVVHDAQILCYPLAPYVVPGYRVHHLPVDFYCTILLAGQEQDHPSIQERRSALW